MRPASRPARPASTSRRFIRKIATGNLRGSARTILEANIFGGSCARVCPTEELCERACVHTAQEGKPIQIGALQRHATDWLMERGMRTPFTRAAPTGRRIAVVGAGPAGLACAHALARHGHDVTMFEARPKPGGLNEYGIAAYKVADDFAQREVAFILAIGGIAIEYGKALGRDITLTALRRDFDAVFLGMGQAGVRALELAGETMPGVRDAIDFIAELRQAPKDQVAVGRRVVVIGGGNTAIDAATQARRLGRGGRHDRLSPRPGAHDRDGQGAGVGADQWRAHPALGGAASGWSATAGDRRRPASSSRARRWTPTGRLMLTDETIRAGGRHGAEGDRPDVRCRSARRRAGAGATAASWWMPTAAPRCRACMPAAIASPGADLTVVAVQDGKLAADGDPSPP